MGNARAPNSDDLILRDIGPPSFNIRFGKKDFIFNPFETFQPSLRQIYLYSSNKLLQIVINIWYLLN